MPATTKPDMLAAALSDADKAERLAQEATQKAAEARLVAQAAAARAQEQRETRRRAYSERVLASYDAEIADADKITAEARRDFERIAVENPLAAITAYLAWVRASHRAYGIEARFRQAASTLNVTLWRGSAISSASAPVVPPFIEALGMAVGKAASNVAADVADGYQAEVDAVHYGTGGAA